MRKLVALLTILLLAYPTNNALGNQKQNTKQEQSKEKKSDKKDKDNVEKIGDREVDKGMNWYSLEKEIALGKALAQQVEAESKLVDDPVIGEYVNRIGQNLVRNSDAKVPFTIKVIDSDEINAFALPGGFFFVNSGLILEAEDEAELAGVMSHEIAHVTARHGTRNATKAELANLLSIPLIFIGGPVGFGGRQAAGLLIPMGFMKFSRNFEKEADYLGMQYMYKTGYDPQKMIAFFEKLQAKEKKRKGTLGKLFSTHPQISDRIEDNQKLLNNESIFPNKSEYIVTTSEFDDVKERLARLQNLRKGQKLDPNKPTLRRTQKAPDGEEDKNKKTEEEKDERPTLKRRN